MLTHGCIGGSRVDVQWGARAHAKGHDCVLVRCTCICCGRLLVQANTTLAKALKRLMKKNPDPDNSRNRLLSVLRVLLYASKLDVSAVTRNASFEPGTALAWVPVYPKNVGEQFINSVVPIKELLAAGLLDARTTRLRPFTLSPRFRPLVGSLVDLPVTAWLDDSTGREAERCRPLDARRPVDVPVAVPCTRLSCHDRLAVCKLRNTLESNHLGYWEQVGRMRPWAAGQAVADRLLGRTSLVAGREFESGASVTARHAAKRRFDASSLRHARASSLREQRRLPLQLSIGAAEGAARRGVGADWKVVFAQRTVMQLGIGPLAGVGADAPGAFGAQDPTLPADPAR